ncbi:STAS domain-containing protein [Bounagaea algeriensis]
MSSAVPPFPDDADNDRPPRSIEPEELGSLLRITATRPNDTTVLLRLAGEIDEHTVVRLEEALAPRLLTALHRIVVDLSAVEFLGVAGLQLLEQSRLSAAEQNITLRVVATGHEVLRALHVAGLDEDLLDSNLQEALPAAGGAAPEAGGARSSSSGAHPELRVR